MKVKLASNYGFCFGVKRAIKIAEDYKDSATMGPLIHNQDEINRLKNDFNVAQSMFSKIYKIEDFKTGIENIIKTKLVLPASIDVDNSDKKLNLFSYLFYDKFKFISTKNTFIFISRSSSIFFQRKN